MNHDLFVALPFPRSLSAMHAFLCSNRQLAAALQQPRIRAALAEFRADPQAAALKYESDDEINQALDLLEKSLSIDL